MLEEVLLGAGEGREGGTGSYDKMTAQAGD